MEEIIYNSIGLNYNTNRAADPRILNIIETLLDLPIGSVIADIGAGTGNYSNALADLGYQVFAVEPSETMRHQAKPNDKVTWTSGAAESIPLPDQSVNGIIVILAIHHYSSLKSAANEMKRICPGGPIVLFTLDPRGGQEHWFKDYFFEIYQRDFMTFPPIEEVIDAIAFEGSWSKEILNFPLPKDLSDKNMHSAWSEPEKYLDAQFRQNTSGFALASPWVVQTGLSRLQKDLRSGAWDKKYGYLRTQKEFNAGFTFIKLQKNRQKERQPMITQIPFGNTGHLSRRIIFGAAALSAMRQERADQVLETLLKYEVNHIDVAASYGDAELRVGSWMKEHRKKFFLATKTGERTASGARDSIQRSIERLQVDQLDLIQFHNLTDEPGWEIALGPGGALEAAIEARSQGLVRFIGVTGHGTRAAEMHLRSLDRFEFDSVLLPYNYMLMQSPEYVSDVNRLIDLCANRGVAVQTIKSVARRRWREGDTQKHFSWYEPVKEPDALRRVVHWVLSRPNIFLNTTSDATLLPLILEAASEFEENSAVAELEEKIQINVSQLEMEPIFVRGVMDTV